MQTGGGSIWNENTGLHPWYQNFCCALIQFLDARQDFKEKNEKHLIFSPKFDVTVTILQSLKKGQRTSRQDPE